MKKPKVTLIKILSTAVVIGAATLFAPSAIAEDNQTKLNNADVRFILNEVASGTALVNIAQLGEKKAQRAEIKSFAGMLVADQTKTNAELQTLATSKGVEVSSERNAKNDKMLEKLAETSGADFEKEFLSLIVKSQEKSVKSFEDAAKDTKDSELKAWAAKTLPAQQAHLDQVEELSSDSSAKTNPRTSNRGGVPTRDQVGNTTEGNADNSASNRGNRNMESQTATNAGNQNAKIDATDKSANKAGTQPDNTATNKRDRDANSLTPLNQGNDKADIDTTAEIRKGIMDQKGLSVNAQNVKVITKDGHVTLRGPVDSEEEKRIIGEIATRIATPEQMHNQLEVRSGSAAN